jgi:hypothetical protein
VQFYEGKGSESKYVLQTLAAVSKFMMIQTTICVWEDMRSHVITGNYRENDIEDGCVLLLENVPSPLLSFPPFTDLIGLEM